MKVPVHSHTSSKLQHQETSKDIQTLKENIQHEKHKKSKETTNQKEKTVQSRKTKVLKRNNSIVLMKQE